MKNVQTLSDCFEHLDSLLCDEDKDYLFDGNISERNKVTALHHTLGRHIRNSFGLWSGSSIAKLLKDEHNIIHPDDKSSFIITEYIKRGRQ